MEMVSVMWKSSCSESFRLTEELDSLLFRLVR